MFLISRPDFIKLFLVTYAYKCLETSNQWNYVSDNIFNTKLIFGHLLNYRVALITYFSFSIGPFVKSSFYKV